MRILHAVTYISEDGAFGGPVAVALAQTAELARRGHEVELIAGWDGKARIEAPGVGVRLFPVKPLPVGGFSGLRSPELLAHLRERRDTLDVAHVHLARDLITLRAAHGLRRLGVPYVVQPHGMVMPDGRPKARVFDALWTRGALRGASTAFALTAREATGLAQVVGPDVAVQRIANGIAGAPAGSEAGRDLERPEVVFLARLHPRKRVLAFARMAQLLAERGSTARFTVIGPDEGELPELRAFMSAPGAPAVLEYAGPIPQGAARARLSSAAVYVLPSFGEVFPMTVLEALSVGTPAVITQDCGIADELAARGAAAVTDGSPEQLADAVARLLDDRQAWADASARGLASIDDVFSIGAVADQLERAYLEAR